MGKTVEEEWRDLMMVPQRKFFDNLPEGQKSRWMGMGGVGPRKKYDSPKYVITSNEKKYQNSYHIQKNGIVNLKNRTCQLKNREIFQILRVGCIPTSN